MKSFWGFMTDGAVYEYTGDLRHPLMTLILIKRKKQLAVYIVND